MKVAINVGGYHDIGTGHVHRQLTLMEEKPDYIYCFLITEKVFPFFLSIYFSPIHRIIYTNSYILDFIYKLLYIGVYI